MNAVHGTAPPSYSVVESDNVRRLSANSSSSNSVSSGSPSSAALSIDMVSLHSSLRDEEYEIQPKTSWIPQEPRDPRRSQCLLEAHGIYAEDFVAFLDNLTVAQGPPAPLAMLNTAGSIAGLVPYHWAQLAGGIANVTAGLGTAATRIIRTKLFLDKVNRDYFEPRGLKASICKSKTLAARVGCGERLPELWPTTPETYEMSLQDRRMRTLAPYVAPLSFEVPPPSKERNFVDRMTEKQIERAVKKKEKQRERKRSKIRNSNQDQPLDKFEYVQCLDGSLTHKKVPKLEKQYERNQRKMEKAERKAAEKLDKKEPLESKKIKRKEEKKMRKAEKKCQRLDEHEKEANSRRADKMTKSQAKDRKKSEKMEFLLIESWTD
ncbi:hypothetical protein CTAM01_08751 [Colletotrichum tamarilloi]|uniref:Uncharacterized protein n=1 Tax=Colletotrichum tamarilloi TaxID=1209934 RepID=A0ABQ9R5J8_9PEZI|nr:uncharacterized protein CTAM01_08751 [Colletotrichum tamarilloi]KAK1495296.1 hypothetical protein CTAM01_08751 [Colletotrichum tamarilloi]